jgi:1-acyl-sn-glycerol-3-phosphate acyltransferase
MDTIALLGGSYGYFRMLGNKEMSKIPLLGIPYKQIGILVDRSSKVSRTKSYKLMNKMVRNGTNVAIFPEGKFNLTSDKILLDFYDGAFKLALDTGTNIIPVIMPDANKRWNNKSFINFTPGKLRVIYLDAVDISKYGSNDLDKLKQDIFNKMETELKKYI